MIVTEPSIPKAQSLGCPRNGLILSSIRNSAYINSRNSCPIKFSFNPHRAFTANSHGQLECSPEGHSKVKMKLVRYASSILPIALARQSFPPKACQASSVLMTIYRFLMKCANETVTIELKNGMSKFCDWTCPMPIAFYSHEAIPRKIVS